MYQKALFRDCSILKQFSNSFTFHSHVSWKGSEWVGRHGPPSSGVVTLPRLSFAGESAQKESCIPDCGKRSPAPTGFTLENIQVLVEGFSDSNRKDSAAHSRERFQEKRCFVLIFGWNHLEYFYICMRRPFLRKYGKNKMFY